MKLTLFAPALVIAVATAGVAVWADGEGTSAVTCTVGALQAKAPSGTTITAATVVAAKDRTPRYCQVDGHAATPGNEVNFRLGLPENWNGKYYFVGVGGTGGTIGRLDAGLNKGYAAAS